MFSVYFCWKSETLLPFPCSSPSVLSLTCSVWVNRGWGVFSELKSPSCPLQQMSPLPMNCLTMTQPLYCVCNFYFLCPAASILLAFTKQVRRHDPCLMKLVSEKEIRARNKKKKKKKNSPDFNIHLTRILVPLLLKHNKILMLVFTSTWKNPVVPM